MTCAKSLIIVSLRENCHHHHHHTYVRKLWTNFIDMFRVSLWLFPLFSSSSVSCFLRQCHSTAQTGVKLVAICLSQPPTHSLQALATGFTLFCFAFKREITSFTLQRGYWELSRRRKKRNHLPLSSQAELLIKFPVSKKSTLCPLLTPALPVWFKSPT